MDPANPTCPLNPNWSTSPQMAFRVVERPGERPVLLAEGVIDDNLIQRLGVAIDTFQGDEIRLRSSGGNPRVANEAARLIRQNNLTTRIPTGWACGGACAFMFLGGIVRSVDADGLFILQTTQSTGDVPREQVARAAARQASEDSDFLLRMGVSRTLLSEILYRESGGAPRRCLTQPELARYNVTNRLTQP